MIIKFVYPNGQVIGYRSACTIRKDFDWHEFYANALVEFQILRLSMYSISLSFERYRYYDKLLILDEREGHRERRCIARAHRL